MMLLRKIFWTFAFSVFAQGALTQGALAQEVDSFRIAELEGEIRKLTGQVEELNFQLLQMQENFRLLQQDNEFRFQQLEGGEVATTPPETSTPEIVNPNAATLGSGNENFTFETEEELLPSTLHFDEQGNLVEAEQETGNLKTLSDIESLNLDSYGTTPDEVFASGKTALEIKSYNQAENAFRAFLTQWPTDERAPEARYYLGESLFSQRNYFNAANVYLSNHNDFPQADIAPDNLLGLALSLAGLNQRETACVTYGEILRKYPQAQERLGARIRAEQNGTRCNNTSQ